MPGANKIKVRKSSGSNACMRSLGGNRSSATEPRHISVSPSSRSEEHTSELQSLMRISYAVFCLKKKKTHNTKYSSSVNTCTSEDVKTIEYDYFLIHIQHD